jgi:hypothetical protein
MGIATGTGILWLLARSTSYGVEKLIGFTPLTNKHLKGTPFAWWDAARFFLSLHCGTGTGDGDEDPVVTSKKIDYAGCPIG